MRKKQAGQAFILVLIVLAIGALLVVPALRLSVTELKSSQIVVQKTRSLYAVSAAQEWVLWNLTDPNFASGFTTGIPKEYDFDVCGTPVNITIVMRAVAGAGAITLATDDVIRPTKTVEPSGGEDAPIPPGTFQTYTYIIKLEQLSDCWLCDGTGILLEDTCPSCDGTGISPGLDAIYDVLPKGFSPQANIGPTYLSLDNGDTWESFPAPSADRTEGQWLLRWPASGNFTSPMRDFEVEQVKMLKFTVTDELNEGVYRNWVVLKPWNTLSGATAPITVGNPTGQASSAGMLQVNKTSEPKVIPPFTESLVTYTITITNLDIPTRQIQSITDYLPPGFTYSENSTTGSDITSEPLWGPPENINGVDRQVLRWNFGTEEMPIFSNTTLTLTFQATTTQEVSGNYYNEVIVLTDMDEDVRNVFLSIGVSESDFGSNFSWNTGEVMVPAYDSEAEANGTIIDANLSLVEGGVIFSSWQIR